MASSTNPSGDATPALPVASGQQPTPMEDLPTQTFSARYGQPRGGSLTTYEEEGYLHLRIPLDKCTMNEMEIMCEQVCNVILKGSSVAVAAGDQTDVSKVIDPATVAKATFTMDEKAMFKDWEDGLQLDRWDFAAHESTDPLTSQKEKKFTLMAQALNKLYNRENITAQQARGWVQQNQNLMPLCVAQGKILKSIRDAPGGQANVDLKELMEKRVCTRVIDLIRRKRNEWGARWSRVTRAMRDAEQRLQVRVNQIR